jgi:GxxExxY protein
MYTHINQLTHEVIGAAIEVHRKLGPGLLRGVQFEDEYPLPLEYKGIRLECGYRVDILVDGLVAVEVKSIQALAPIHEAQLLTYLRVGEWRLGLLINFNVEILKNGIRRKIMGYEN